MGVFRWYPQEGLQSALQRSNRDQTKTLVSATDSLTYRRLTWQRWDTSDFFTIAGGRVTAIFPQFACC